MALQATVGSKSQLISRSNTTKTEFYLEHENILGRSIKIFKMRRLLRQRTGPIVTINNRYKVFSKIKKMLYACMIVILVIQYFGSSGGSQYKKSRKKTKYISHMVLFKNSYVNYLATISIKNRPALQLYEQIICTTKSSKTTKRSKLALVLPKIFI